MHLATLICGPPISLLYLQPSIITFLSIWRDLLSVTNRVESKQGKSIKFISSNTAYRHGPNIIWTIVEDPQLLRTQQGFTDLCLLVVLSNRPTNQYQGRGTCMSFFTWDTGNYLTFRSLWLLILEAQLQMRQNTYFSYGLFLFVCR